MAQQLREKVIVFDLLCSQPIGETKFHGGGEYIKTVFRAFAECYQGTGKVVVCFDTAKFLDDWILNLIEEKAFTVTQTETYEQVVIALERLSKEGQVRFFAGLSYMYDGFTFPSDVVTIGTCHGLRAIEKQTDRHILQYYKSVPLVKEIVKLGLRNIMYKKYYRQYENSIKNFDVVITDSNHSAYSIQLNYPELMKNKNLHIFYPLTQMAMQPERAECDQPEKYIMLISANRWIKNSYRAIQAIDGLYEKELLSGVKTRIYGALPANIKKKIKHPENFCFFDYVSSDELEQAYRDCDVFFYPTLNEGFGNVPMEAMKYGKTCVISAICSLPEVYGDVVYYCNPYDIMEMQNRLLQAIANKKDTAAIERRLAQLLERQLGDMDKLCNLIEGKDD